MTSTARPSPRGSNARKRRPGARNAASARARSASPVRTAAARARAMSRPAAANRASSVAADSAGAGAGAAYGPGADVAATLEPAAMSTERAAAVLRTLRMGDVLPGQWGWSTDKEVRNRRP